MFPFPFCTRCFNPNGQYGLFVGLLVVTVHFSWFAGDQDLLACSIYWGWTLMLHVPITLPQALLRAVFLPVEVSSYCLHPRAWISLRLFCLSPALTSSFKVTASDGTKQGCVRFPGATSFGAALVQSYIMHAHASPPLAWCMGGRISAHAVQHPPHLQLPTLPRCTVVHGGLGLPAHPALQAAPCCPTPSCGAGSSS